MADTKEKIEKLLNENKVVLFMKGSPNFHYAVFQQEQPLFCLT